MRRRFSIVGKQFDPDTFRPTIEQLEIHHAPMDDFLGHVHMVADMVERCRDKDGKFCADKKADRLWQSANYLALQLAEYREKVDKLQEALDLLVDQCPDEWYDGKE